MQKRVDVPDLGPMSPEGLGIAQAMEVKAPVDLNHGELWATCPRGEWNDPPALESYRVFRKDEPWALWLTAVVAVPCHDSPDPKRSGEAS